MGLTIDDLTLFDGEPPSGAYYPAWISGATYKTEKALPSTHTHDERYYTESEVDALLTGKASSSHNHDDRYYTESEVSGFLTGKSDTSHTHDERYYTESEISGLLTGKADASHDHDDRYYTESEVSGFLTGKSDVSHTHDDRYYTESEMDALLSGKADVTTAPTTLAYAASLTPDCNDGLYRKITLTGNCTLNPPTNGSDGMKWKARFFASGSSRNLTFNGSIKIPSDSSFTGVKTISSGETYITQLEYGGSAWWLQTLLGGWS